MSDWQVGDLAMCMGTGIIRHGLWIHLGENAPPPKSTAGVVAIETKPCGCIALILANGCRGVAQRFRKIRPDEHEACEEEFQTLLKRSKVSCEGDPLLRKTA